MVSSRVPGEGLIISDGKRAKGRVSRKNAEDLQRMSERLEKSRVMPRR
jgi:hypothetical protein